MSFHTPFSLDDQASQASYSHASQASFESAVLDQVNMHYNSNVVNDHQFSKLKNVSEMDVENLEVFDHISPQGPSEVMLPYNWDRGLPREHNYEFQSFVHLDLRYSHGGFSPDLIYEQKLISAYHTDHPSLKEDSIGYPGTRRTLGDESCFFSGNDRSELQLKQRFSLEYPIIRQGVSRKPLKSDFSSESRPKLQLLDIDFHPSLDTVLQVPWSASEEADARRIIRMSRVQIRAKIDIHLQIIDSETGIAQDSVYGRNVIEVSCLKNNFSPEQLACCYITSVEVINIIELLIGKQNVDRQFKRVERGRIRSNLCSLWLNEFSPARTGHLAGLSKQFLDSIANYSSRKPFNTAKEVRLLPWINLDHAVTKAAEFYRVIISEWDSNADLPHRSCQAIFFSRIRFYAQYIHRYEPSVQWIINSVLYGHTYVDFVLCKSNPHYFFFSAELEESEKCLTLEGNWNRMWEPSDQTYLCVCYSKKELHSLHVNSQACTIQCSKLGGLSSLAHQKRFDLLWGRGVSIPSQLRRDTFARPAYSCL